MSELYGSVIDSIKEIVGGFDGNQKIAIGVVLLIALFLGFLIGACAMYAAGVSKGKEQGARAVVEYAKGKAEEQATDHKIAMMAAKQKSDEINKQKDAALEAKQAELEESERSRAEAEQAVLAAERSREEAERIAREAELAKDQAEQIAREAERSKEEAERVALEAEARMRVMKEMEEAGNTTAKKRKKKIDLLEKQEILDFAEGLTAPLPTTVYPRGGKNLPDSCRVGICTYLLVYERNGMVKLVLRLHPKSASALEKQFRLFTKAVHPRGEDWYRWILSSEVKDLSIVTAAIEMSYKYVYLSNYGERGDALNVTLVNKEENLINDEILKYKDIPDRDFIVASDAVDGQIASYSLYGKKEIAAFAKSLVATYPVSVTESEGELSPSTLKVGDRTFMMAYEKDGVTKMVFRFPEDAFKSLKRKHPTADISPFPKASGYHWYVAYVDETFKSNSDVEDIIRYACAYVCGLREE